MKGAFIMTKNIKIDFSKREDVLNLSEDWFDLGSGLYAAKVGKEASKALFTSKRAAGREFLVIDTKARAITAKDTLASLDGFQKADKAAILAVSSYEATVKDVLSLGLTWYVVAGGKAWAKLDKPRGGKEFAVLTYKTGTTAGRWIYFDSKPLETGLKPIKQTTAQIIHLMETPTPAVSNALFNECYKKAAKLPGDKQRELFQNFDERSNDTTSNFFTEVNDFIRLRSDYISSDKEAVAYMLAWNDLHKPAKDTGFMSVTLDRKEVEQAPAAAKEKAVKATTQPQPAGLQFGPALVADKNGKATIASLLHAGKVFASRTIPAEFSDRFKKYSEDNRLLLYVQGGPALGQVATYRGWIKQGRQVSKGQHGLKILAPRMVEKEDGTKAIDGLRLVTLFSVDQTEKIESQEA